MAMSFSLQLIIIFLCFSICSVIPTNNTKTRLIVYKFTASGDTSSSKTTEWAQQIAIDEINANPDILPDYYLELVVKDAEDDEEQALVNAINVAQLYYECLFNETSLISPIVLGPPWSSHSVLASRVFDIYHLLQISSSATSPALSDKDKYLPFFRTIGNDKKQGTAIIELCKNFSWTRIGVVYQNDNYGQEFNKVIQELAGEFNLDILNETGECTKCIEVNPWSFLRNDTDSIKKAAEHIKRQQLYVTILISQGADVYTLFKEGNFSYPHFFVGTDAWFSAGEIIEDDLIEFADGYIGTMPGNIWMFDKAEYVESNIYEGNETIYDISKTKYENVTEKIKQKMGNNSITYSFMGYAYDAMYALAYSLDTYDRAKSLKQQLLSCDLQSIFNDLHDILNNISFIGMTGPVDFTDGDRDNGLFVYGMAEINGNNVTIKKFGHFANNGINFSVESITYSNSNRTVKSDPIVANITMTVGVDTIGIVGGIYGFIVVMALILCCLKRKNEGKIEYLSMTIGLILISFLMISYGLQKNHPMVSSNHEYDIEYDIWCLSIPVIVCIAFTFTFLAFITSKSLLALRIIIKLMNKEKFMNKGDQNVSNKVWRCLVADFTVISVWITVYFVLYVHVEDAKLLKYQFIEMGDVQDVPDDDMEKHQHFYAVCSSHWATNIFYCILLIYKIGQMLYAIDNNVGGMISYIILVVCMFCIGLIAAAWYTLDQMLMNGQIGQDTQYLILSFVIIFIYLLWIIPEYYYLSKRVKKHLCNKNGRYDSEEPSPAIDTTGTTNKSPETSTITDTSSGTGGHSGHPHLTAQEQERIVIIHKIDDVQNNDDMVVEEMEEKKQDDYIIEEEESYDADKIEIQISKIGDTAMESVPSDSEMSAAKVKQMEYDDDDDKALGSPLMMSINEEKTLSVDDTEMTELQQDDNN